MRTFDLSPLYRSTIGFDRLVDLVNQVTRVEPITNWPPYDIERTGEDHYRITMAVAGFRPEELQLVQQENTLVVSGERQPPSEGGGEAVLHRGLVANAFRRSFELADYVEVTGASLENGLLRIELRREVPAELRPRRIAIATGTSAVEAQNAARITAEPGRRSEAA